MSAFTEMLDAKNQAELLGYQVTIVPETSTTFTVITRVAGGPDGYTQETQTAVAAADVSTIVSEFLAWIAGKW